MVLSICTVHGSNQFDGGSEVQLKQIQNEMIKQGHLVTHLNVNHGNHLPKKVKNDNGSLTYNININNKIPLWEIMTFIKIIIIFRFYLKGKIDVIYTRGYYYLLPLIFLKKSYAIPIVTTATGKSSCYTNFQNFFINNNFKKSHLFSKILLRSQLKQVELLCLTNHQSKLIKANFNIDAKIIQNGHPKSFLEYGKKQSKLIVWIGNSRPVKRLNYFLDIVKEFNDSSLIFLVIGNLSRKDYTNIAKSKKLSENIFFIGSQTNDYCNEILSKSLFLINTSTSEGFSNTFIQAWLRGIPVLTLGVDPDNLIFKKKLGMVCESKRTLIKIISKYSDGNDNLGLSRNQIRQFAEKNFSINITVSKLINHMEKLISESKAF